MKRLIIIPFLSLFMIPLMAQDVYLQEFQQKWTNAQKYTLEVAEAMPETKYSYKPSVEQMSFMEQLLHMVGNVRWLTTDYLKGKRLNADLKKTDYTKEEILEILKEAFANATTAIDKLKLEELGEEVSFFAGPMTRRQILVLLNDHLTHHRGQLVIYLRLNGVQPPSYRGW